MKIQSIQSIQSNRLNQQNQQNQINRSNVSFEQRIAAANFKDERVLIQGLVDGLAPVAARLKGLVRTILIPGLLDAGETLTLAKSSNLDVFVHGASAVTPGANTGKVSMERCADKGIRGFLIGHSEERKWKPGAEFAAQVLEAIKLKSEAILCVGNGKDEEVGIIVKQLKLALEGADEEAVKRVLNAVAYEPLGSIGKGGKPCPPNEAKEAISALRDAGYEGPVLYGGSVDAGNAQSYMEVGFDGVLVGRKGILPETFAPIMNALA